MTVDLPIFSPGVGYGMILGIGGFFAVTMSLLSLGLARFMQETQTSEMFATAKHSIKTGLTASAVVSSWTIAATLLSSTTDGYQLGLSGPFWYGSGATVQIFLFAVAAIELKRKAPKCHTFLEVVKIRYGRPGHILLMFYAMFYQIFTTVNLLVGGSTLFANLTGINRDAACFLTPIGVLIYTLFGGIKATFLTDWAHTIIIYIIMLTTLFVVYATSDVIGSPDRMYDLLKEASALHPIAGNADGSYMTMSSSGGGYVGLIFIGAGFAAAVDSQLFQKAIAADPASTLPGYMLGGLCWFTIPFVLATTFGLTAAAAEHLPSFPTYPDRMSAQQVSDGMAMPFAAIAVMGKGGAAAILVMAFMAVTSAMSSETIASSTLLTYDVYKAYIKPDAGSAQLVRFSQISVIGFGIVTAAIAVAFNHAGFSTNYLITVIGIFVDSAIVPMACTIMWKKQSLAALIIAPLASSCAAILAWLLTAYTHYGSLTLTTTSESLPLVAGNMMSLCGPVLLVPLISYIKPDNFDWDVLKNIQTDAGLAQTTTTMVESQIPENTSDEKTGSEEKDTKRTIEPRATDENNITEGDIIDASMDVHLKTARNKGIVMAAVLCLAMLILWPVPMYASGYVFSKTFFRGWIVVVFIWAFFGAVTIIGLPIWESRRSVVKFFAFAWRFMDRK